jgi:hypothetical protein
MRPPTVRARAHHWQSRARCNWPAACANLPDIPSACAAFECLRRSRVEKVAARAARINQAKAPGAVARVLMPLLMPLLMRTAMNPERTIGPEQRYVIDWDAPVTADPALH